MNRCQMWAILGLLVFGVVRLPLELGLEKKAKAERLHGVVLDLGVFDKIGQMGFVAALSGFRAVVADGFWIHASMVWERVDWAAMKLDFDIVTTLQPRCVMFWDIAAWHMYANASVAAFEDRKQPRAALRLKAQREYWKLGEDYLLHGIANNPENPGLYTSLGTLYRDRLQNHEEAAKVYLRGSLLPGAPVYLHRFAAYELARCPGHEREAYEKLLGFYRKGESEHLPTLLRHLGELEEKLNVPPGDKVAIPKKNP